MQALQYIFTSWKNGNNRDKGFMIYSKSEGITDSECEEIKNIMQYSRPDILNAAPTEEEIEREFPVNFSSFILSSGRCCIAQSTYLGKDYSGRYGNYIIHAFVLPIADLNEYPISFYGQKFIKTFMTNDELDAASPVPPLAPLEISIKKNDELEDEIMEFVESRKDDFAYFISALIESGNQQIPFYFYDNKENIVKWITALNIMLPQEIAYKISFSTYSCNWKILQNQYKQKIRCQCLWDKGNKFDFKAMSDTSICVVADFKNRIFTKDIKILDYAKGMAISYVMGMSEIDSFKEFLCTCTQFSYESDVENAYHYFRLYKIGKYTYNSKSYLSMLDFGKKCCPVEVNKKFAQNLLGTISNSDNPLNEEEFLKSCLFLSEFEADFQLKLNELILNRICSNAQNTNLHRYNDEILDSLNKQKKAKYDEFLYYINKDMRDYILNFILESRKKETSVYFIKFVIKYLSNSVSVEKKTSFLIEQISKIVQNSNTISVRDIFNVFNELEKTGDLDEKNLIIMGVLNQFEVSSLTENDLLLLAEYLELVTTEFFLQFSSEKLMQLCSKAQEWHMEKWSRLTLKYNAECVKKKYKCLNIDLVAKQISLLSKEGYEEYIENYFDVYYENGDWKQFFKCCCSLQYSEFIGQKIIKKWKQSKNMDAMVLFFIELNTDLDLQVYKDILEKKLIPFIKKLNQRDYDYFCDEYKRKDSEHAEQFLERLKKEDKMLDKLGKLLKQHKIT